MVAFRTVVVSCVSVENVEASSISAVDILLTLPDVDGRVCGLVSVSWIVSGGIDWISMVGESGRTVPGGRRWRTENILQTPVCINLWKLKRSGAEKDVCTIGSE